MMENPEFWKHGDTPQSDIEQREEALENVSYKTEVSNDLIAQGSFEDEVLKNKLLFVERTINLFSTADNPSDKDFNTKLQRYSTLLSQLLQLKETYRKNTVMKNERIKPDDAEKLSQQLGISKEEIESARIISDAAREHVNEDVYENIKSNLTSVRAEIKELETELQKEYPAEFHFITNFGNKDNNLN